MDDGRVCTSCMWIGVRVQATHIVEYEYAKNTRYVSSAFACAACAMKWVWGLPRNESEAAEQLHIARDIYGYAEMPKAKGVHHAWPIDVYWDWVRQFEMIERVIDKKRLELQLAADSLDALKGRRLDL